MDPNTFEDLKTLGRKQGIFTFAQGWRTRDKNRFGDQGDESFEAFLETVVPGKLQEAGREVGESKVRKGLWIAENAECPDAVLEIYKEIVLVLRRRGLDCLFTDQVLQRPDLAIGCTVLDPFGLALRWFIPARIGEFVDTAFRRHREASEGHQLRASC